MLELDVQLHFPAPRQSAPGFTLDVRASLANTTTGLFGPSGAGKTALLHCIAGLLRPDAGRIVLDGEVLFDAAARQFVRPHRRGVGVVFQDARLFPHYSVRRNLEYGMHLAPRAGRRHTLDGIAEMLDIAPLMDRSVAGLSGGEQKRVAIGRAILAAPRLLLLDEPLAGLDQRRKSDILPFLRRVRERAGIPAMFVSHDLSDVLGLCDDLLLIEAGRAVGHGRFLELLGHPDAMRLMQAQGLVNALSAQVQRHDAEAGMTRLVLTGREGGGESPVVLKTTLRDDVAAGDSTIAVLRPEDVALARGPVESISMQNQFPGQVTSQIEANHRTYCVVDIGAKILAEVTRQTVAGLQLHPGQKVWALFKASAIQLIETSPARAACPPQADP